MNSTYNMTLKVFPPVHSLSLLSQEQMKSAFSLPKHFDSLFFDFNANDGTLIVNFRIKESVDDFHLVFEPEKGNIDQFFKVKVHNFSLSAEQKSEIMPLYVVPKSTFFLIDILKIISIIIVVLGWSLFVAGFFLHSLTGLETLLTFQICALTLRWVQNVLFIGLRPIKVLKYLSLYNIRLFDSEPIGELPPKYRVLLMFDFDLKVFGNNFNLSLLIVAVFLFGAFANWAVRLFKRYKWKKEQR